MICFSISPFALNNNSSLILSAVLIDGMRDEIIDVTGKSGHRINQIFQLLGCIYFDCIEVVGVFNNNFLGTLCSLTFDYYTNFIGTIATLSE